MKKFYAEIEVFDFEPRLLNSIVTETGKLKQFTETKIHKNIITIHSKKYSHFVATILNILRILKSFEKIEKVMKNGG